MRVLCCSEDLESPDPGYPIQSGNYKPTKKVRFLGQGQSRRSTKRQRAALWGCPKLDGHN